MLTARFNQDSTCLAVGTRRGYQVFQGEPFSECHTAALDGGVAVVEMLFSSSLIALVGAGSRRLRLWNTRSNTQICELNFSSAVLGLPDKC